MDRYLIDTNVVSDYFSGSLPKSGLQFLDDVIDNVPNLSVITQIELLSWNATLLIEDYVKNFISDSQLFEITPEVVAACVSIRKAKKVKTPDAIIAATAIANGMTIITNNEKDFGNIKGLKFINPHKI